MASENASPRGRLNGGAMLSTSPNERALLSCLLAKLAALDADVLVGHNIGAYELAVLMGRLQSHKVGPGAGRWSPLRGRCTWHHAVAAFSLRVGSGVPGRSSAAQQKCSEGLYVPKPTV